MSAIGLLGYFEYKHLPERLQKISKPFADLAAKVVDDMPPTSSVSPANTESEMCLRKLLESKDCAVRAAL